MLCQCKAQNLSTASAKSAVQSVLATYACTLVRQALHDCTNVENGVLSNRQQTQNVVNGFVDQGEFEALKTLSGWEAAHCDEYPFYAKIKVSVQTV